MIDEDWTTVAETVLSGVAVMCFVFALMTLIVEVAQL